MNTINAETNYIFSSRFVTNPIRKIFGKSKYKKQIIERDKRIYTVWDITMQSSYFFWVCYKNEEIKSKLKSYKNIK
jgi:hypothetical protein